MPLTKEIPEDHQCGFCNIRSTTDQIWRSCIRAS